MSNRFAIIDIGSNNVLLLISEIERGYDKTLYRESRISTLAKGMKKDVLTLEGIKRAALIIKDYLVIAKRFNSTPLLIATSAARVAKNFNEFQNEIRKFTDARIKVISGEQEAIYNGLAHQEYSLNSSLLLFDIGGGSTEFTFIEDCKISKTVSVELGIRRMENKFGKESWKQIEHINDKLSRINFKIKRNTKLMGIGGTATSLAAICLDLKDYDENLVHGHNILREELDNVFKTIYIMKPEEVPEMIPFNPISKDLLLTGINIIREIIAHFKAGSFFVSDRTWQYGVIEELRQENSGNDRIY